VTSGTLTIDPADFTNTGTLEAITGGTLVLDGETVTNSDSGVDGTVSVDGTSFLDLEGATIDGGLLSNSGTLDSTGTSALTDVGITNTGTIEVTSGTLTIDPASFTNTGTLEAITGGTLVLDGETVTNSDSGVDGTVSVDGTSFLDLEGATIDGGKLSNSGTVNSTGTSALTDVGITNTGTIEVTSGTLTIDPADFTNTGTLEVKDGATVVLNGETVDNSVTDTGGTTNGTIQVDAHAVLDFEGSAINGGNLNVEALSKFDSTGISSITGATITNSGVFDVTSGTLTIDATSILNNAGKFEADGGNLIINAAVSGNLEIVSFSGLELGATAAGAYSAATVTFDVGSTGTLTLDDAAASKDVKIAGLDDDNTIDFTHLKFDSGLTTSYSGTASGGTLSIFEGGLEVAEIKLTGDYTGVHWVLGQDSRSGTTLTEAPGAIISGLDSHGNAVEDQQLTVSITDAGQSVTNATYTFETFNAATNSWEVVQSGSKNTYTPTETDEGKAFKVDLSFTDVNG